jgi:hypothetical protein
MNRIPPSAALVLVAAHLHTYDEPLQTDITGAAVIGHEVLAGRALYADMWDHKPPTLHLTHAAASRLVGYGPRASASSPARSIHSCYPGESFYEWGSEGGLYYLTQRPPPGAFSVWPVALGPAARDLTGYVFAYLTREQPALYIVANWTCEWITWRHPVPEWLESNFRPMPGGHERGPFTPCVRRGGKLEARVVPSLAVK